MFDLITEDQKRPLRRRSPAWRVTAVMLHSIALGGLVLLSVTRVVEKLPAPEPIMTFVAAAPAPPRPPPPPPMVGRPAASHSVSTPDTTPKPAAAPLEAPAEIKAEQIVASRTEVAGVEGGVEGGEPGGVTGGIVGGLVSAAPPPPPPPAPVVRGPVRIGGQIATPALLHRVEPTYPDIAAVAQLSGVVILEAIVDTTGCVESVKVLRSRHRLLDQAAVDALKQWRYTPLVLNGAPASFVLTVTFNFSVSKS